ncbi:MAG: hypothetical protein ABI175_09740 [Polyangiales bacterium]
MRNLGFFSLAACLLVNACSSSPGGDPGSTDDGGRDDTAIGGDAAIDTGSGATDSATASDSATADVAVDAAPVNEPRFELVLGGNTLTPTSITTEKVGTFSAKDPTVTGLARFKVTLPKGATDRDAPYLDFEIYTPLLGSIPYSPPGSTSQPKSAYLQYHYSRPGVAGFPKAVGPGMNVVRDGRDGWLEVTGSGTFEIDDVDQPFTLKLRQPVPKKS